MFTVEIGTVIMGLVTVYIALSCDTSQGSLSYNSVITAVLLPFANFAEAIAEARGKTRAEAVRKTRQETPAKIIRPRPCRPPGPAFRLPVSPVFGIFRLHGSGSWLMTPKARCWDFLVRQ